MTEPAKAEIDAPPIPAASLESIVCTERLHRRPRRPPDHEKENRALVALASALADSPRTILQTLADKVCEILDADSSGLSLLTKDQNSFLWPAVAGAWRPYIGGGAPRHFAPCGVVLDHNAAMLFTHWERRYPYLAGAMPLAEEGLIVPFYVNGEAMGTIWAVAHDHRREFDAEDLRLLESMGRFASAAYQTAESVESLKREIGAREKAEAAVRELASEERKQAEERLRRSEAFLAEGQHLARTGNFSWRVATDQIQWSEQLYRIFEFDPSAPVTLDRITSRVHPEDLRLMDDMVAKARGGASDLEYEHRLLMPDRSIKYLHLIAHRGRHVEGELEYIGAVQDVTQRRASEEALAKVRSEFAHVARVTTLGTLTASMAHEVNQPLAGIIMNASTCLRMLANDPPDVDGARETAKRTIRDGNRASEVISRLRALFGKKDAAFEAIDLNDAAREVIALSLSELQRDRVTLRLELGDHLPAVTGDRIQLQQVILNLLRNASDAMSAVDDRPRELLIRTERDEGDQVRLSIRDAGVGLDSQTVDKLFDAFYTTKNDGMGIGLSVSRSIVESHHGRLWATPNEGLGATFSFSIPCTSEGLKGATARSGHRTRASTDAA